MLQAPLLPPSKLGGISVKHGEMRQAVLKRREPLIRRGPIQFTSIFTAKAIFGQKRGNASFERAFPLDWYFWHICRSFRVPISEQVHVLGSRYGPRLAGQLKRLVDITSARAIRYRPCH